jgi:acetyl/propionyl-CoA carboxylase alpha subunit
MPPFRRILIANRGEIAVRIARACRELGVESVAVYSDADAEAMHTRVADVAVRIGPAAASASYLDADAILEAARRTAANAIHPGYGFLSESAAFARAVEGAGLTWIGPPPETQEALGNKLAARRAAEAAGVPIVPGTTVPMTDAEEADLAAIGFPMMLKAAAGGGGRGMRRVDEPGALANAMAAARREAAAAFGDGTIYAERLVERGRHVEVQLLGDRHGALAVLGERDCSVQRRHQKLLEEAPSPGIDQATREALWDSARRLAASVLFHSAATVEFLVDRDGSHYFLEMNTRLQVEHGVTELVTGLDLVAWQIRVAAGDPLDRKVLEAEPRGHAIEVRIYAEDPWADFRPVAGTVTVWRQPDGPGVRLDTASQAGMAVSPEYDPLLAKLMVLADDRPGAVARLRRALDEMLIGGLQTDLGFHRWLVDQPAFAAGDYDTTLIPAQWGSGEPLGDLERSLVALAALSGREELNAVSANDRPPPGVGERPWARAAREEGLRDG